MEVALTFGAVGDLISIALLAKDIVAALNDSRGSAKEYRDLIQSLVTLDEIVQSIEKILSETDFGGIFDDLRPIAQRATEQTHQCLDRFRTKICKYGPSLAEGGSGNVFKDVARKIQWKLEEKDVERFRAELAGHTSSLKLLLEITQMRIHRRNHEASVKQLSETETRTTSAIQRSTGMMRGWMNYMERRILSQLSDLREHFQSSTAQIFSILFAVSGELSNIRAIVMRLERPFGEEYFILEDVTGRSFPIHLKTITSWSALEYVINDRFKGKKGSHRVRRGQYSLYERATRQQVNRVIDWDSAFMPYQRVDMSLLCRQSALSSSCPHCGTVSDSQTGDEVKCAKCERYFTRVEEEEDEILPKAPAPPLTPHRRGNVQFGQLSFAALAKRAREGDEVENESLEPYTICHRPKRQKGERSQKRKRTIAAVESDSDEEDVRGFSRVTLISKRSRIREIRRPFQAAIAESFASVAQRVLDKTSGDIPARPEIVVTAAAALEIKFLETRVQARQETQQDSDGEEMAEPIHFTRSLAGSDELPGGPLKQLREGTSANLSRTLSSLPPSALYASDWRSDASDSDSTSRSTHSLRYTSNGHYATANETVTRTAANSSFLDVNKIGSQLTDGASHAQGARLREAMAKVHNSAIAATPRVASEADLRKHGIMGSFLLGNWDPDETPITLFGIVFDAKSLGRQIYDWSVSCYGSHNSGMADDLRLHLILLASKIKRGEEAIPRIHVSASRDVVVTCIEDGKRLLDRWREILKACEASMLEVAADTYCGSLGQNVAFKLAQSLFGPNGEEDETAYFVYTVGCWSLDFEEKCEGILSRSTR